MVLANAIRGLRKRVGREHAHVYRHDVKRTLAMRLMTACISLLLVAPASFAQGKDAPPKAAKATKKKGTKKKGTKKKGTKKKGTKKKATAENAESTTTNAPAKGKAVSTKKKPTVKDVLAAATVEGTAGTQALVAFLSAKSAAVRKTAASKLGERGDVTADAALATSATNDKSAQVREAAKRARARLHPVGKKQRAKIVVEIAPARGLQKGISDVATKQLTDQTRAAITAEPRRSFLVKENAGKEPGYALLLAIRSVTDGKQGAVSLVQVRCELTLLSLPGRSLRLSSSASAAAGIEGSMSAKERADLISDAVGACAPALAADFIDYAVSRPAP